MKQIALSGKNGKGKFALVDDEDYKELMQYSWHLHITGYLRTSINGCTVYMHRFILNPKDGFVIDHISHNKLDNQRINLRVCTQAQNMANRKRNKIGSSIFKGVSFVKNTQKWYAKITENYKQINLGHFDSELEAAKAYNAKAKELFGEFAHLNKI